MKQFCAAATTQSLLNSKRFQAIHYDNRFVFLKIALPLQRNAAGVTIP